jgi:hypothetical protein
MFPVLIFQNPKVGTPCKHRRHRRQPKTLLTVRTPLSGPYTLLAIMTQNPAHRHDPVCEVEGLLNSITMVDVNVDIQHTVAQAASSSGKAVSKQRQDSMRLRAGSNQPQQGSKQLRKKASALAGTRPAT